MSCYFGDEIKNKNITYSIIEYVIYYDMINSEDEYENFYEKNKYELDLIEIILTLDVCIFINRRISGICESVVDNLNSMRRKYINEYKTSFNKTYIDINEKCDF